MGRYLFQNVVLLGVGLMGGSLAQDLLKRKVAGQIVGFDTHLKNLRYAESKKIISRAGKNLHQELAEADLVILATPVLTIEQQIKELASDIPKNCLVIDLGSTKDRILKQADRSFLNGNFVGTHPMRGREKAGAAASEADMFDGAPCLLVRGRKTKAKFMKQAKALWQAVGARALELNGPDHDRYVAACSHLPHVLSFALMKSVGQKFPPKDLAKIAGKSFKSYTRIAGSDARMWTDIFLDNRKNTLVKIKAFQKELDRLQNLIEIKDDQGVFDYIEETAQLWRQIK